MRFNKHHNLADKHSFLSPSGYSWINYDEDKLLRAWYTHRAAMRGTALHDLAAKAIELGVKFSDSQDTISLYVNDAIDMGMSPEVVLYYSENCFGTADAIAYDSDNNHLQIHDLKTGVSPTSEHQLEVYAAIFCLEYGIIPQHTTFELRIYQSDDIRIYEADPNTVWHIMDTIVAHDKVLNEQKEMEK